MGQHGPSSEPSNGSLPPGPAALSPAFNVFAQASSRHDFGLHCMPCAQQGSAYGSENLDPRGQVYLAPFSPRGRATGGRPARRDCRGERGGGHQCVGDPLRLLNRRPDHSLAFHGRSYCRAGVCGHRPQRMGRPCVQWQAPLGALAGNCWCEIARVRLPGSCLGTWSLEGMTRPDAAGQRRPWAAFSIFPSCRGPSP